MSTFGKTAVGGTTDNPAGNVIVFFGPYTCPVNGSLTKLTARAAKDAANLIIAGIASNSSGPANKLAESAESSLSSGTFGDVDFPMQTPLAVTAGTSYYFILYANAAFFLKYDAVGGPPSATSQTRTYDSTLPSTFSAGAPFGAEYTVYATVVSNAPTLNSTASNSDAFHIIGQADAQGAALTIDATKATLTENASLSGASLAATIGNATTSTVSWTLTLSGGGISPGATVGLDVAQGFIHNANGSNSSATLTVTNANVTAEDITANMTFTATGAHSATVSFDDTATIIGPYLPIADIFLTPADLDNLNEGDPVDFSIQIGGVDAAVADTWTFTPPVLGGGTTVISKTFLTMQLMGAI